MRLVEKTISFLYLALGVCNLISAIGPINQALPIFSEFSVIKMAKWHLIRKSYQNIFFEKVYYENIIFVYSL